MYRSSSVGPDPFTRILPAVKLKARTVVMGGGELREKCLQCNPSQLREGESRRLGEDSTWMGWNKIATSRTTGELHYKTRKQEHQEQQQQQQLLLLLLQLQLQLLLLLQQQQQNSSTPFML